MKATKFKSVVMNEFTRVAIRDGIIKAMDYIDNHLSDLYENKAIEMESYKTELSTYRYYNLQSTLLRGYEELKNRTNRDWIDAFICELSHKRVRKQIKEYCVAMTEPSLPLPVGGGDEGKYRIKAIGELENTTWIVAPKFTTIELAESYLSVLAVILGDGYIYEIFEDEN